MFTYFHGAALFYTLLSDGEQSGRLPRGGAGKREDLLGRNAEASQVMGGYVKGQVRMGQRAISR